MADGEGILVTVKDLKTGEEDSVEIMDDYVITTAGRCYVSHVQHYATGTTVITVKKDSN